MFPISTDDILKYIVIIVENWEVLGTQLSVPQHILDEIRANNPRNIVTCKTQMISNWMISNWMDCEPQTTPTCWWSLVKAAKDMDENLIAQNIENDHSKYITIAEHRFTCIVINIISIVHTHNSVVSRVSSRGR